MGKIKKVSDYIEKNSARGWVLVGELVTQVALFYVLFIR